LGAIAEGIAAYAQPLFESTDGSIEDMNRAMTIAQLCWNLALVPEDKRDVEIDAMKSSLKMTDTDFADFRQRLILPMIQRHCDMFPALHHRSTQASKIVSVAPALPEKYPGTSRNAPCPCGSRRKYKRCCGSRQ